MLQEDLVLFAQQAIEEFGDRCASMQMAPLFVIEACAASPSIVTRRNVAAREDLPDHVIEQLAADDEARVLVTLIANKSVGIDKLERLADHPNPRVRESLTFREDLTREMSMRLWRYASGDERDRLLRHGDLDPAIIENVVMKRSQAHERIHVAQRDNLATDLVAKLARDKVIAVREMIASRRDLTHEVAMQLFHDQSGRVRASILSNPNLSSDVLHDIIVELQDSPQYLIQLLTHDNQFAKEDTETLANHTATVVRHYIAGYPELSADLLEQLSRDESDNVRISIASRTDIPNDMALRLLNDSSSHVVAAVLSHHQFDADSIDMILDKEWTTDQYRAILLNTLCQMDLSLTTMYAIVFDLPSYKAQMLLARDHLPVEIRGILQDD